MLKKIPQNAPLSLDPAQWELTFEDDFDFLDLTKWKLDAPETGVRRCCFNVDDPDVVFTKDSCLHIRTLWKNGRFGEGWYSAMLDTSRTVRMDAASSADYRGFSQTYGYFEAKCRVAKAIGIWSAFWMMPDNTTAFSENDIQYSGEDGVEIDIMESPHAFHRLPRLQNQNIHVLHADGYDSRLKTVASPAFFVPEMYNQFHTYGLLWEPDKYCFYIDGQKTWETTHIYKGHPMGICRVPEYLLLSTEVSGSMENGTQYPGLVRNDKTGKLEKFWCGSPERNDKSKPYDFEVDYVRCYRRKGSENK